VRILSLDQFTKEQLADMALIDMAYEIIDKNKQAVPFKVILDEILSMKGLTEKDVRARIAQFYTELNIDGRFLCLGDNLWGLRSWYPVDQAEEDTITQIKPKKKKAKKVKDEDDLEDFDDLDDDDLDYDEEFEEDDLLDDEDESFDDLDVVADEFEDEELIDEEEEELIIEDDVLVDDEDEEEEDELEDEDEEEDL
jgi:DNA-directed RNA polymerase subunit delta